MRHHSASILPPIIIISRPSFNTYHHQCTIILHQSFTPLIIINVPLFRLYFTTYHHHFAPIIHHLSSSMCHHSVSIIDHSHHLSSSMCHHSASIIHTTYHHQCAIIPPLFYHLSSFRVHHSTPISSSFHHLFYHPSSSF